MIDSAQTLHTSAANLMTDPLIQESVDRVSQFEARIRSRFGGLGFDQLAWQPDAARWSVGQCLEHVIELNELYFPVFDAIATGSKRTLLVERIPILPGLWGKLLLNGMSPDNAKKMRAPRGYNPSIADVPPDIVERFCTHQQALAKSISNLDGIDLDAQIIQSPLIGVITYSLRHALLIIVAHEERHLNQADRVLEALHTHTRSTA